MKCEKCGKPLQDCQKCGRGKGKSTSLNCRTCENTGLVCNSHGGHWKR